MSVPRRRLIPAIEMKLRSLGVPEHVIVKHMSALSAAIAKRIDAEEKRSVEYDPERKRRHTVYKIGNKS